MPIVKTYALTTETSPTGLYVSSDLGLTWTIAAAAGLSTSNLTSVAASPYDTEIALISSQSGISRSTDGGATFTNVYTGNSWRLFYKDLDSIISIPAGIGSIAISNNNGASFTPTSTNIVTQLAVGADTSVTILTGAVYFTNNSSGFISIFFTDLGTGLRRNRIWRTTDGGYSWVNSIDLLVESPVISIHADLNTNKVILATEDDGIWEVDYSLLGTITQNYTNAQINVGTGGIFQQVGVDPSKVYFITDGGAVYYSIDSGTTLVQKNAGFGSGFAYPGLVVFDENTICTFVGTSAEIYRSTNGGTTLTSVFTTNGRTVGFDSSIAYECGTCPDGFQEVTTGNPANPTISCERTILGGPLCNPPYFYNTVNNTCAIPSSAIPFNIVLNIDTSGSVDPNERILLIEFLSLFLDEMAGRLVTGNTKIAIVLWNTLSCLQLDFTSDITLLKDALDAINVTTAINPTCTAAGYQYSGGTQHAVGFERSVRTLFTQATIRPTAENVIITVTDGAGIGTANITDLGYTTIVNNSACELMTLSDQVKANLAGKPSKVMLLVVGQPNERDSVKNAFINNTTCAGGPKNYPSLDQDGNPFFYDGGNFAGVSDFAKQLILGLESQSIPSFSCADGCVDIPGSDNLGYCLCTEELPQAPCNFVLTDCLDPTITIITDTDLSTYDGQVITIQGQDNCFIVGTSSSTSTNVQTVIVNESFATCAECGLSFALINCKDSNIVYYTVQEEFLPFSDPSRVVTLDEFPGECWTVTRNTETSYTPQVFTLNPRSYDDCISCVGDYFYLTSCVEEQSFILTDTDLTEYLGQIVSIAGFPGACFIVEKQACNCISVKLFSKVSGLRTYQVERAPVLINGKNQYIVLTNKGERFLIAFNNEENRWEVWNIDTDTLLSYSALTQDCPYTSLWENVSENDFRMISITSCDAAVYAVEIDDTYLSCECCLFKNC